MQNYSLGHPGVRRFLPGQKISYAYRIINPAPDSQSGESKVETVTTIFRDGQQVFATEPRSLAPVSTSASRSINVGGALQLTRLFTPGDYTLQVAVRDRLAKPGRDVTTQFIDFQVLPAGATP
jgi:hypothetical protein